MRYRPGTTLNLMSLGLPEFVFIVTCLMFGCVRKEDVPVTYEMSKQDVERWYESEGPRFGDPKDYLPPNTVETMPCDYTKGDMHDIIIFAAQGKLDDIGRWYTEQLPIHIYDKNNYDPGQLTLYSLSDRDSRSYSVILADSEIAEATGNFGSYVGAEYLARMIKHRPCVIGALYLSEIGWYDRQTESKGTEK